MKRTASSTARAMNKPTKGIDIHKLNSTGLTGLLISFEEPGRGPVKLVKLSS